MVHAAPLDSRQNTPRLAQITSSVTASKLLDSHSTSLYPTKAPEHLTQTKNLSPKTHGVD
ncbi:hypothetical protein ABW20_dc0108307 [Dactylellina cionopaga]|nr:hypothetical protein ABW20_dc0108307 [Dactylellina cionopaga]